MYSFTNYIQVIRGGSNRLLSFLPSFIVVVHMTLEYLWTHPDIFALHHKPRNRVKGKQGGSPSEQVFYFVNSLLLFPCCLSLNTCLYTFHYKYCQPCGWYGIRGLAVLLIWECQSTLCDILQVYKSCGIRKLVKIYPCLLFLLAFIVPESPASWSSCDQFV